MKAALLALAIVLAVLHPLLLLLALAVTAAACAGLAWLVARALRDLPGPLDLWRTA